MKNNSMRREEFNKLHPNRTHSIACILKALLALEKETWRKMTFILNCTTFIKREMHVCENSGYSRNNQHTLLRQDAY